MNFYRLATIAGVALLSAGIAAVPIAEAKGTKPLNAGKDGFKSNAGAGNGAETTSTTETVTTYSTTEVTSPTGSTTETVPGTTTTTTERTVDSRSAPYCGNARCNNFRQDVTYKIVTTTTTSDGTLTTTTTYETVKTTYKTDTTTTTYVDHDPGNSGSVNKAPEAVPEPEVVSETSIDAEETSTSTDVSTETVPGTTSSTTAFQTQSLNCNAADASC